MVRRWMRRLVTVVGSVTLLALFAALIAFTLTRERVPRAAVLTLDLEQGVLAAAPTDPVGRIMQSDRLSLPEIVSALDRAAADDRILGLVVRIGGDSHGIGTVQELRQAITRFRDAGKPAFAFAETMGELQSGNIGYYLASACDRIYLQPAGDIGLTGLIAESPFLRGTLDKLDVEPRLDQRHEYKNAMNTFTETGFTAAHREAMADLVGDLFRVMVEDIASSRGFEPDALRALIDRGPFLGAEAEEVGLVDGIAYRDQVHAELEATIGRSFELLSAGRYAASRERTPRRATAVALINAAGTVARGESGFSPLFGGQSMGSDTVTAAFRDAIEDDSIKAILFRVDSGGGSYVASDAIWRMVLLAQEAGKPVVVSMGDMAASGGYFVAMDAERIIAQPGTLTGSIGVLGGKLVTRDFWQERLGVTWDSVGSSANAGMWTGVDDYTEHGWARHQDWLDRVYDDFTLKVAAGRDLAPETVRDIARGRVWTGAQALELGLVDALGGYAEAQAAIREVLGLDASAPVRWQPLPEPGGWRDLFGGSDAAPVVASLLQTLGPALETLRQAGAFGVRGELEAFPPQIR